MIKSKFLYIKFLHVNHKSWFSNIQFNSFNCLSTTKSLLGVANQIEILYSLKFDILNMESEMSSDCGNGNPYHLNVSSNGQGKEKIRNGIYIRDHAPLSRFLSRLSNHSNWQRMERVWTRNSNYHQNGRPDGLGLHDQCSGCWLKDRSYLFHTLVLAALALIWLKKHFRTISSKVLF